MVCANSRLNARTARVPTGTLRIRSPPPSGARVLNRAGVLASVGLVVAVVLTGCTEAQSGQAVSTPTQGSPSPGAPSRSTQPSVAIPSRPKELNLTGLKACSLFTDAQLAQLKLDRKRDRTADDSQYKGMAECFLD